MTSETLQFDPDGVGVINGAYFGLPFEPDDAALVLISAPWDVTVSYGAGTAYGPDAIIEASTQLDFYDPLSPEAWRRGIATAEIDYSLLEESERLRHDAVRVIEHLENGGATTDELVTRKIRRINEGCVAMNRKVYEDAAQWFRAGKIVGLVGGDHSTSFGAIRAAVERHPGMGILHLDAHRDLRAGYEGFTFSHASIMYHVLHLKGITRLTQVGVRDFSATEQRLADRDNRVVTFGDKELMEAQFTGEAWDATCRRIVATLPDEVYLSFDIDALSFENCPNTGTPVCGGLTFNQAVWLVESVVRSGRRIVGFDVVEVAPSKHDKIDAITGARVLWKLCGAALRTLK